MLSLYFPFEKQNLMSLQLEKLVTDGDRSPLQNKVRSCDSWKLSCVIVNCHKTCLCDCVMTVSYT